MKIKALVAGIALATLSGCSSIVSDSNYAVAINSVPTGAQFVVTNKAGQSVQSGVTPSTITLRAGAGFFQGETYTVTMKKEGFSDKLYTLDSTIDGWYFGNILIGGLVGLLVVDPATGAMFKLPNRLDVSLDKSDSEQASTLTITTIDNLTDAEKSKLIRITAQ